ncbi:MAG: glutaredoxin 3 [Hyphomicrobiales bacterium]|nr:glutaredoxin 3 [Hyphomicrobiales bacterium]MDE2016197.1 glutaredoxin 3 [Hyphomicrobiales bacterium]
MPDIEIYTKATCGYCAMAKELLRQKGAPFREIPVDGAPDLQARMAERAGGCSTVPQIFVDERHVGGCDDLYALDRAGGLDPLLTGA